MYVFLSVYNFSFAESDVTLLPNKLAGNICFILTKIFNWSPKGLLLKRKSLIKCNAIFRSFVGHQNHNF